jgi:hypothetical protein
MAAVADQHAAGRHLHAMPIEAAGSPCLRRSACRWPGVDRDGPRRGAVRARRWSTAAQRGLPRCCRWCSADRRRSRTRTSAVAAGCRRGGLRARASPGFRWAAGVASLRTTRAGSRGRCRSRTSCRPLLHGLSCRATAPLLATQR